MTQLRLYTYVLCCKRCIDTYTRGSKFLRVWTASSMAAPIASRRQRDNIIERWLQFLKSQWFCFCDALTKENSKAWNRDCGRRSNYFVNSKHQDGTVEEGRSTFIAEVRTNARQRGRTVQALRPERHVGRKATWCTEEARSYLQSEKRLWLQGSEVKTGWQVCRWKRKPKNGREKNEIRIVKK